MRLTLASSILFSEPMYRFCQRCRLRPRAAYGGMGDRMGQCMEYASETWGDFGN